MIFFPNFRKDFFWGYILCTTIFTRLFLLICDKCLMYTYNLFTPCWIFSSSFKFQFNSSFFILILFFIFLHLHGWRLNDDYLFQMGFVISLFHCSAVWFGICVHGTVDCDIHIVTFVTLLYSLPSSYSLF